MPHLKGDGGILPSCIFKEDNFSLFPSESPTGKTAKHPAYKSGSQ